jgi:predicted RNase H-like HicB family nuclease
MRYAIVIEKSENNFGAWAPDLPGCVAVGDTVEEVEQLMREAIELHLAGMREDGDPIPPPTVKVNYVDVAA